MASILSCLSETPRHSLSVEFLSHAERAAVSACIITPPSPVATFFHSADRKLVQKAVALAEHTCIAGACQCV